MKKLLLLLIIAVLGFYVAWPTFAGYQIHSALQAQDSAGLAAKIDFPSVRQSIRGPVLAKVEDRMGGVMKSLGPAASAFGGQKIARPKLEAIVDGALAEVVEPGRIIAVYARGGDFAGAMQDAVINQIEKLGGVGALLGGGGTTDGAAARGGGTGGFGGLKLPGGLGGGTVDNLGGLISGGAKLPGMPSGGDLIGKLGLDTGKIAKMLFPKAPAPSATQGGGNSSSFGLGNIKSFGFAGPLGMQLGVAGSANAPGPDVTAGIEFKDFDWRITSLTPHL